MPHVVIIGAGPSGLYLANKLRREGIKDIVIYDPRAGDYVRPGFLNPIIFKQAESGIQDTFSFQKKSSHIRDIEKILYNRAVTQNILIEKKQFIRFSSAEKRGIYIAHQNTQQELVEEFIPCDYIFDCTGSKRALVHEINNKNELNGKPKPFVISSVSEDVIIKKHLIAYLKMDNDLAKQTENFTPDNNKDLSGKSALEITRDIEKLRQFGWTELTFPDCHHTHFKENKNCLYIECPNDLHQDKKIAWMETVLNILTNAANIQYEPMESKKGRSKPNFNTFVVDPKQIDCFTYHEKGLPYIAILGDAQIEPNFVLGHGIRGSFTRADILVKSMIIRNGKITYYDSEEYNLSSKIAIKSHQQQIINYYKMRKLKFRKSVYKAKSIYEEAIIQTLDLDERNLLIKRLKEIDFRIDYYNVLKNLDKKILRGRGQIYPSNSVNTFRFLVREKNTINTSLSKLTEFEILEASERLQSLISVFKEMGNQFFQQANYIVAIRAYKEALTLYPSDNIKANGELINIYSNIILCYRKVGDLESVLEKFNEISFIFENLHTISKEKILFHVIKALEENLERASLDKNKRVNVLLAFDNLLKTHRTFIEQHLADSLKFELKKLTDAGSSSIYSENSLSIENPELKEETCCIF